MTCSVAAGSDTIKDGVFVALQAHATRVAPHYADMRPYTMGVSPAFELNLARRSAKPTVFNRIFSYPTFGIGVYAGSPGTNDVIGNVFSFLGFMEIPILEKSRSAMRLKYSLGLAYFTKHYDSLTNPLNEAIGAPFNAHVNLNFTYVYYLTPYIGITAGTGLTHFSNGAVLMPNKGINMYDVSLGIRYHLHPYATPPRFESDRMLVTFSPTLRLQCIGSLGYMQLDYDPATYMVSDLTMNMTVQTLPKTRGGIGVDLFYNESVRDLRNESGDENPFISSLRSGVYGAFELDFKRLMIVYNLGLYLFYKSEPIKPMYQKVGVRVAVSERLFAAMVLKAHQNKAEYTQFGLGYTFLNHSIRRTSRD